MQDTEMLENVQISSPYSSRASSPSCSEQKYVSDDEISVGCPSPALGSPKESRNYTKSEYQNRDFASESNENLGQGEDYFRPLKKLKMVPSQDRECSDGDTRSESGVKSFSIADILNHRPSKNQKIVRPWDDHEKIAQNLQNLEVLRKYSMQHLALIRPELCNFGQNFSQNFSETCSDRSSSVTSDCCSPDIMNNVKRINSQNSQNPKNNTPLDALFQMTSKTFDSNQGESSADGRDPLNLFSKHQQPKKKRKSRTAFTNHQIFELEKRFLYQKYLSPADRDEIAASLNLSNAQVITWFQNRRAKLKRDMEELKKDVESAKILSAHKSFLENVQDLGILKKKSVVSNDETT